MDNMELPTISRRRALVYALAVVVALVVGGRFLLGTPAASKPAASTGDLSVPALEAVPTETSAEAAKLVVHVAGAVRQPGIYVLPEGSRIDDAIREAGGPRRRALLDRLNLAAPLVDGQQVFVPLRGTSAAGDAPAVSAAGPPAPVNLNTATLEELDALPGVGPVTAANIVAYRAEHGPFASIDELDAIPGIGPARLEQLREVAVV